jgi:hypothetical protein
MPRSKAYPDLSGTSGIEHIGGPTFLRESVGPPKGSGFHELLRASFADQRLKNMSKTF